MNKKIFLTNENFFDTCKKFWKNFVILMDKKNIFNKEKIYLRIVKKFEKILKYF